MEPTLLYFDDEAGPAARLADAAGFSAAAVARHRFPDGELRLRLPERLPPNVVIFRSLYRPNEKLIELLLTARTAHQLGARRLSLVSPYLAYMRQDIAFNPGEAISQRVVGAFLADLFDDLVTIDPHLHRIHSLDEAIPLRNAVALSGAPMLATLIAQHRTNPCWSGPMPNRRSGWRRPRRHTAGTAPCAASSVTVIATWTSPCRPASLRGIEKWF